MDKVQREDIEIVEQWFSDIDVSEPKAILMYDISSEDFSSAVNGWRYKMIIWELDQWLRGQLRYHRLPRSMDVGYSYVRTKLRMLHTDQGLVIE